MRKVDKPWGHELIWAEAERYVGKVLFVKQGGTLSLQYHEQKDETIMVWSGRVRVEHYDEGQTPQFIELGPQQALHVPPRHRHRTTALEDSYLFEVSTTELDDVVRLEDRYGRVK